MSRSRAFVHILCLNLLVQCASAADTARFSMGRGHLAARVADGEWQGIHLGDQIPAVSQLRTSPASNVRIDTSSAEISLSGDSTVNFDLAAKQISIEYGRILLRCIDDSDKWIVTVGQRKFSCAPGSEVEISVADTIGVNVLTGTVEVAGPANETVPLKAPLEWLSNNKGETKSSAQAAEDWAAKIRRRTEPRPEQGLGQLVTKDPQSGSSIRLEVAQYHVNVSLQAPLALVQIDQSFFNPHHRQEEGTFIFNLPDGASVSRFAMYVSKSELIEGELIDRRKADQVYTTIVRSKRDPAILEQIGNNLFRMRVFPIFAQDTKRILLDFTIPLVSDSGRYRFDLPLLSDLKPVWDFQLSGTISPPFATGSIVSSTHPKLDFKTDAIGTASFQWKDKQYTPPVRFTLEFKAPEQTQAVIRSYTSNNRQHLVVAVPASENPVPKQSPAPVDLLVLVDSSSSANDLKLARLAARTIIRNLRDQDRWKLGCIDSSYRSLTAEWLAPRSAAGLEAIRKLDDEYVLGASLLDTSVEQAVSAFMPDPQGRRRAIVYLGDGDADASNQSCWNLPLFHWGQPDRIEFHSVRLGDDKVAGQWLKTGIQKSRGRVFSPQGNSTSLRDLFEWSLIGMPAPTPIESVEMTGVESVNLYHDETWLPGQDLLLYGQCSPMKALTLRLKLANQGEKLIRANIDDNRPNDIFAGRLWAEQRLKDKLRSSRDDKTIGEIVDLCQEWSLMSPYTAYLVLETEVDYQRWNISRSVRHRYWKPFDLAESLRVHSDLQFEAGQRRLISAVPANNEPPPRPIKKLETEKRVVGQILNLAKTALKAGNPSAASVYLSMVGTDIDEAQAKVFRDLQAEVHSIVRREAALKSMNLWQRLVDRQVDDTLPAIAPLLLGFSHCGVNPEYIERHPHSAKLLKPAPDFGDDEVTLTEFAKGIKEATGVPVIIDVKVLTEEGISAQSMVHIGKYQQLPIRTLATLALDDLLLTMIPEKHAFRITTQTAADEHQTTHVYPIPDLLRPDILSLPERLGNLNLDYDTIQRNLIETRLKQPISVNFDAIPLDEALAVVLEGTKFRLDRKVFSEEGISPDRPVTFSIDNVPREFVLKEILQPELLTYVIRYGLVEVTTMTAADERMETRVYSAVGLIDEKLLDRTTPKGTFFGGGMGGGMGGMGGGMGGMGGGMGGMGGGMGGMGGGAFGGININPGAGDADNAVRGAAREEQGPNVAQIGAPNIDDADADSNDEPQQGNGIPVMAPGNNLGIWQFGGAAAAGAERLMQQSTPGKWSDSDGEGGSMNFHRPSMSFVVRQTQSVHAELKETFEKLRKQLGTSRIRIPKVASNAPAIVSSMQYQQAMRIIQQSTPGRWEYSEGEGGSVSPHLLSDSLTIRQTERVHEEVESLFAQLRRSRYVLESLPWTSLDGIDDLVTFFDRPAITDLPKNNLDADRNDPIGDELKLLSVRQPQASLNQRWLNKSALTGRARELSIRAYRRRLELELPDRVLRAEGARAAVAYPGLTLVEIDAWGDAVRQYADAAMPWLGHRSDEELSRLFDVRQESEDAASVTLRLTFPAAPDAFLRVTFAKTTGQPEKWQSVVANQVMYELHFSPKLIIAVDATGKELESWTLEQDDKGIELLALNFGWNQFVITEPSKPESPLARVRQAFRSGQLAKAQGMLKKLVEGNPTQPLLNFLYAWSIRVPDPSAPENFGGQRYSLHQVAKNGSADLLALVTPGNFPSIDAEHLREIFLDVPAKSRSADLWQSLSDLATGLKQYDQALGELEEAISRTADAQKKAQRQFSRINLLLQTNRPMDAEIAAKELVNEGVSPVQLLELGQMFGQSGQHESAAFFYNQYRNLPNLDRKDKLQSSISQGADDLNKENRWRALITMIVEYGESPQLILSVISEATKPQDAAILGRLASELKPGFLKRELTLRQLELATTKDQADLVLALLKSNELPLEQSQLAARVLAIEDREQEAIAVIEQRLRKGEFVDESLLQLLANAYQKQGQSEKAMRVTSGPTERAKYPRPQRKVNRNTYVSPGAGAGFFNVPLPGR